MDRQQTLGFDDRGHSPDRAATRELMLRYINLRLLAHGLPPAIDDDRTDFSHLARGLLDGYREATRQLASYRCPADRRIESFLASHASDLDLPFELELPDRTFVLDRHGVARELSLPIDGNYFTNGLVTSYRVMNGVLHNPAHDRRTTRGTFHVADGGLPVPADKLEVPRRAFAELFRQALSPPRELMILPFTSHRPDPAATFVSLLVRPLVCPEVPGVCERKTMEIRFFVPGGFVSNLDFVESIFGNAGDPFLPQNDAALDVVHWTGHTGAVILAPHLTACRKKELGLPHLREATDRQKADGMCWESEDECYNDGQPFKVTCRTDAGVIVTLIADNYFGYCKKEVKTQISYAANLFGNVEEEHGGGAMAFPSYNLGDEFQVNSTRYNGRTLADVTHDFGHELDIRLEGYAIDKRFPELVYIPENAFASIRKQRIEWTRNESKESIPLLPGKIYMAPSGYRLKLEKHPGAPSWRLIGTVAEGVVCHKPCTVSGGGKSEISKSLVDYMIYGPIFVSDLEADLDQVERIFARDYTDRWRPDSARRPDYTSRKARPVLSPKRSLGSVIKLLSPSPEYTDAYNEWLASLPNHIYALVFIIKRFQKPGWAASWREQFGVDVINGEPGHELKFRDRKLVGTYLRVGFEGPRAWRTYKVRQDFAAAAKIQFEDDITASVVVPASRLNDLAQGEFESTESVKFVTNCEYRLFQRPDDAIHRGLDTQTEQDLARDDNFLSNFEPLSRRAIEEMTHNVIDFDAFSEPMKLLLESFQRSAEEYVVCSANPRQIDGRPSKNPRYLQNRPDLVRPLDRYVAEQGMRLFRAIPSNRPVHTPVNSVLFGRRNNAPDEAAGIRGLAVYSPIHYQELPELFMDFICSLTGKSPSTTGFGSEGALTKGPFNALRPTADLNNALVSFILTGLAGFSTAAGYIGPQRRMDHDISLLIPEIWCRLAHDERDPSFLIQEGMLEKLEDYELKGEVIQASRLGYRITYRFLRRLLGRVFDNPSKVFDQALLKPETQDPAAFADGVKYIAEAHRRVAQRYLDSGEVDEACPPLRALIHIMASGSYLGRTLADPRIRAMFTRDHLLKSAWYRTRLETKQRRDQALWDRHRRYLDAHIADPHNSDITEQLQLAERRAYAERQFEATGDPAYLQSLVGMLGADPMGHIPDEPDA